MSQGLHEHPVAAAKIKQDIALLKAATGLDFVDRDETLLSYPTITEYVLPPQTTDLKLRHESGAATNCGDPTLVGTTVVRGGHISWWCF